MEKYKLNVLLVTYNHEKFVSEAIESILAQNCRYDYEIVVADDCSTDSTLKIINEYKKLYPQKFTILDNQRKLGITKNYQRGFKACNGEYIAVLEGDDYWVTTSRLQKNVDFLEQHRECAFVFNRIVVFDVQNMHHTVQPWSVNEEYQLITVSKLVKDNFIGNFSSCVYRTDIIKKIDDSLYELVVYDWMLNIVVAQNGLIGYLPEVMSVYRLHPSGAWTQKSEIDKVKSTIECIEIYDRYLNYRYTQQFTEHKNRLYGRLKVL